MNHKRSIIRFETFFLFLILFPLNALSQADTIRSLQVADTSISQHSLYTGIGYGNNMIYLGSTISQNRPFEYSTLTYGFHNEFFASASAFHLTDINPFLAFYNLTLSYGHTFNSWFDIALTASRYQVSGKLADTLFSNFTYGDITLGIDWKLIYSKLSAGGLFSQENQVYFQLRNSRYFQTPEFLHNKTFISFDPYVNLLFGTLVKAETSTGTLITTSYPYNSWGSGYKGNRPSTITSTTTSTTTTTTTISYSNTFGLMEIDFGLPVALNFKSMTIEVEASYVLPKYSDSYFPGPKGFVLMLSGFFRIK